MRKYIALLTLLLISLSSKGSNNLIHCLGKEELKFYKRKFIGPEYQLNQEFIAELGSLGAIEIKERFYKGICGNKSLTTSVSLLKHGLIYGESILSKNGNTKTFRGKYKSAELKRFFEGIPVKFFKYISDLQSQTKRAKCLEKAIPSLGKISTEYRYLGGHIHKEWIREKRKDFENIFRGLRRYKSIQAKCAQPLRPKKR